MIKRISFAGWLVIIAAFLYVLSSTVNGLFVGEYKPEYYYKDFVHYLGASIAEAMMYWALRVKFANELVVKSVCQWLIDMALLDAIYITFGNPHQWEPSKILYMVIAALFFLIIYKMEKKGWIQLP